MQDNRKPNHRSKCKWNYALSCLFCDWKAMKAWIQIKKRSAWHSDYVESKFTAAFSQTILNHWLQNRPRVFGLGFESTIERRQKGARLFNNVGISFDNLYLCSHFGDRRSAGYREWLSPWEIFPLNLAQKSIEMPLFPYQEHLVHFLDWRLSAKC